MLDSSFQGNQFLPGTKSYDRANDLYASSSYGKERDLNPGEIYQPTDLDDVKHLIVAAKDLGKRIAIRTGGHQYSGASSTGKKNIQLDLKPTFRRPKIDLQMLRKNGKAYIRSSVSWSLAELYDFMGDHSVFLPTGQCATVCLGGHVQTGGYGMLARSFGLLADWMHELEIVDYDGKVVKFTKESNPDLFYGFMGGSPGNLGVLTHFTVEVQEDSKYPGSKGLWLTYQYERQTLNALLDILVAKGQDPNFPRNYDFTVNIMSRNNNLLGIWPGTPEELKAKLPDTMHDGKKNIVDVENFKKAVIIVYAQWVNFGDGTTFNSADLWDPIQNVPRTPTNLVLEKDLKPDAGMSEITSLWLFKPPREFPYAYVKRTNSTTSTTLIKDGWAAWFTGRVDEIISNKTNGLWISSQIQVYGGDHSEFRKNANNGTAHCFRDSTLAGSWDVFYQPECKPGAESWQQANDEGALTHFSADDRRVLWGSYGDWDMTKVWKHYFDAPSYERLRGIRKKHDPHGTFTANPFCVEAAP